MYKHATKHKHSRHEDYDLYADLLKIRDAFSETAKDVKGKTGQAISQSLENVKEKSADLQENVVNYAKERPYKTLGITFLSGLILGFLIHRK